MKIALLIALVNGIRLEQRSQPEDASNVATDEFLNFAEKPLPDNVMAILMG